MRFRPGARLDTSQVDNRRGMRLGPIGGLAGGGGIVGIIITVILLLTNGGGGGQGFTVGGQEGDPRRTAEPAPGPANRRGRLSDRRGR